MAVLTLSLWVLSQGEVGLLTKGLSFCPAARFDNFDFVIELFRFGRTLKLKKHFNAAHKPPSDITVMPFRLNSKKILHSQYVTIKSYLNNI